MLFIQILILLPFLSNNLVYYRLSTLGQQSLKINDYVTSTLGLYRFSLDPKSCQLNIQYFDQTSNQNTYKTVGFYSKIESIPCNQLVIKPQGIFTSDNKQYFVLKNLLPKEATQNDFIKNIKQTFVTIDDNGVIRLQSILFNQTINQKWITNFRNPQKNIFASNNRVIEAQSTLPLIKNNGQWGFSASKGEFRIFLLNDKNKQVKYKFNPFILSTNIFKDWNDFATPLINFQGLKYQKRCGISKDVSFRSPFVFVLNKYWPQLRVLDQQGYQIFNLKYPSVNCLKDVGLDRVNNSQQCISWFCPPQTFQLNGRCVSRCPAPYFSQIKQNKRNRCMLVCEAGSIIDNQTRICTCSPNSVFKCPFNLTQTPFGCLCQNRRYFFAQTILYLQNKSLQEICLKKCPLKYFQHSDGLCVRCPLFCLNCVASNTSMSYLKCIECEQGFQTNGIYCRKKCENRLGNYLNNNFICQKCKIKLCRTCQTRGLVQFCNSCLLPYALFNNTCINLCPKTQILDFVNEQSFQCKPISTCSNLSQKSLNPLVQSCKVCTSKEYCFENCEQNSFHYFHNKSSCFCLQNLVTSYVPSCNYIQSDKNSSLITYDNFLQKNNNPCNVIEHYFNFRTNQCLKCPFGCLTCVVNQKGIPQCTSCVQNYYLSVYDSNYCQRQTALAYCYSYNREDNYCFTWDNILQNLLEYDNNHLLCKKSIQNCFICLYKSSVYCKFCQTQFYLHEGKCIKQCPIGFYSYKYQKVCLPKTIQNCIREEIKPVNYLINININTQFLEGYRYFTSKYFTQIQNQNDPIGLIYIYYTYLKRKIQGQRTSIFTRGEPACKVCTPGYGINTQGQCDKCSPNCLSCVYSFSTSCLRCHPFYYLNDRGACMELNQSQRPCLETQFRNQKGICQDDCHNFRRFSNQQANIDPNQKFINCTFNCPVTMTIMKTSSGILYCVNSSLNTLQNQLSSDLMEIKTQPIKIMASCYKSGYDKGICFIKPSVNITNMSAVSFNSDWVNLQNSRLLQQNQNQTQIKSYFGDLIVLTDINTGILKTLFSADQFYNRQTNQYLVNSFYGIQVNQNSSMLDQILKNDNLMHHFSRVLVILFFIAAVINFGKGIDYKLDNVFITMGVIYLSLTCLNLKIQKGFYCIYGFLYGFAWSLGLETFHTSRLITNNGNFFSHNYIQKTNNSAHYLLFVDNNFLRNCWSVFIQLFIVIGILFISWILIKISTSQKLIPFFKRKVYQDLEESQKIDNSAEKIQNIQSQQRKTCILSVLDFDHFSKIKSFCIFIIQNSILGLSYYCFSQISTKEWEFSPSSTLIGHKAIAWIILIIIVGYSATRGYTNFTAAIYLIKRILIGFVIFLRPLAQGSISFFIGLLIIQFIFIGLRINLENTHEISKVIKFIKNKRNKLNSQMTQSSMKNVQSGQKLINEKQNKPINEDLFQFQKAMINNNLLNLPEQSNINQNKNPSVSKSFKDQSTIIFKIRQFWDQISNQFKFLFFEELLICLIYGMLALHNVCGQISVLIIWLILLIFLVAIFDELMLNIIECHEINSKKIVAQQNSLISQLQNKSNPSVPKYYFKIRNNFDYESETRNQTINFQSSISGKPGKSSLSLSFGPSLSSVV